MGKLLFGLGAGGALSLMRVEMQLADADRVRRNLNQFIIIDIGDSLFQRQSPRRREANRLILARCPDIGELLGFQRIDDQIIILAFSPITMPS